jgi:hypothetical protein
MAWLHSRGVHVDFGSHRSTRIRRPHTEELGGFPFLLSPVEHCRQTDWFARFTEIKHTRRKRRQTLPRARGDGLPPLRHDDSGITVPAIAKSQRKHKGHE